MDSRSLQTASGRGSITRIDIPAALATALLALTGIVMALLNARAYGQDVFAIDSLFVRMVIWVAIGTIVYLITIRTNWQWVRSFAWPLYAANILLLVVTLIYGVDSGGNARAIAIFGITVQSSEISKVRSEEHTSELQSH